jgi:hypothetical protein
MNWLPIAGAKKDGTEYDLWAVKKVRHTAEFDLWESTNPKPRTGKLGEKRFTRCKFFLGDWHSFEEGSLWGCFSSIKGYVPTHYCEIRTPQEPLSWPTESGWYWIKNIEGIQWRKLELLPDTDDERGRAFVIDQWVVYEDIATDWKFLPAPVPSFGDAP